MDPDLMTDEELQARDSIRIVWESKATKEDWEALRHDRDRALLRAYELWVWGARMGNEGFRKDEHLIMRDIDRFLKERDGE